MNPYIIRSNIWLRSSLERVFPFFGDARNLGSITPPWLSFEVLTPQPIVMGSGTLIDYRIRVRGMPMRWRTLIEVWDPPHQFVDVQLKGPYRLWHHTHRFLARDGGTECLDEVRYVPIGGRLTNWLFVGRDVRRIFEYRERCLMEMFGGRRLDCLRA